MIDFSVEVGAFQRALASVSGCLQTRNTMPILACVRLRASAGKLSVFASSVEVEAEAEIGADVGLDGEVAVLGGVLIDIVKKLPKAAGLTLSPAAGRNERLELKCARSKFHLAGLDTVTMPVMGAPDDLAVFRIKGAKLRAVIDSVAHCAATDANRWALQGVRLIVEGSRLTAMAFDGSQRAAIVEVEIEGEPSGEVQPVTIPIYAIRQITALSAEDELQIGVSRSMVEIRGEASVFRTRLVGADYDDLRGVFVHKSDAPLFSVKAGELAEVADRVSTIFRTVTDTKAANNILPAIGIVPKEGELHVLAGGNRGVEEAHDVLAADEIGRFAELPIRTEMFVHALGTVFGDKTVSLFQDAPGSPVLITSPEAPGLRYYLAPMRMR